MSDPLLSVSGVEKSFGALKALGPVDVTLATRAARAYRPERLRQDDSHQLHRGPAAPGGGTDHLLRRGHHRGTRAQAGAQRHRPQLPDSAPLCRDERDREPARSARLSRSRPREDLAHADEVLTSVRLEARRDVPAEALSQLELRKLELARALVTHGS